MASLDHIPRLKQPELSMSPEPYPEDVLTDIERSVRRIDVILSAAKRDETITLPTQELIDIITSLSKLYSSYEHVVKMCSAIGSMDEIDLLESLEEAQSIIATKYEHDRDERITLAAAVLHLIDGEPTDQSRRAARRLARSALGAFVDGEKDEAIIDEPVDSAYFLSLAAEQLRENAQIKEFGL